MFKENNFSLDYDLISSNKEYEKLLYSFVKITCQNTPFDYFDHLSLQNNETVHVSIFIEPVGNVVFIAESLETLFPNLNAFFNSQPENMNYSLAGHKIHHYARHIRKGMGIDFRYLNDVDVWNGDIDEDYKKSKRAKLSIDELVTGQELFEFIDQKNRLPIVITSELAFLNNAVSEGMLGEVMYVEKMMPDFFKVLIDLTRFEEHNKFMLKESFYDDGFKLEYPNHRIIDYFIPYQAKINENDDFRMLKEKDITETIVFMKTFAKSNFDGDLEEYEAYLKKNSL